MQITKFWSSSIKFNKAMLWIYFTIMFYIKNFVNPNCKSKSIVKSPDVVNRLTKYIPKSFNNSSRTSSTLLDMSNNRRHNILSRVMKESHRSSSSINRSALQCISMSSAKSNWAASPSTQHSELGKEQYGWDKTKFKTLTHIEYPEKGLFCAPPPLFLIQKI